MDDVFKVLEISALQVKILEMITGEPDDISVKIAALRAAGDLLQQSVTMALITAQVRSVIDPRR